jgi:tetratricopeptide (TPR) repeat protein/HEAT repeat protein
MGLARLFLALALGVAAVVAQPSAASAQGDWSVKRDPFDRRVIGRYKAILQKNPADRDALNKLVGMYKRYRTVALLVAEYQKELVANPNDFSDLLVLGHIKAGDGKADEALALYEKAAAIKPGDAGLQVALGDLYRRRNDPDKAKASYQAALAAATTPAIKKNVLRALADLAQDANDIEGVKKWLEQYLEIAPKDLQVRLDLGDALTQNGKARDAIEIYRKAEGLTGDPVQRLDVIARIGQALEKSGDDAGAIKEYKRAMAAAGKGYYLRRELTARIYEIHRRKQTLADLATTWEKEWPAGRRDHFEWDMLGQLYEEIGLQDKALEAFRAAVKKAPWELDTQRRLISMLGNSGREDEALKQIEAVVRVAPGEPRFQLDLAERYWKRNQTAKALALLKAMEGRFPGDPSVFEALADLYSRWGKEDLALAAYVKLTQIEPDLVDHLVDLGIQYHQRGERAKALAVWQRIINVKTAANYARLAETYADHDMRADALKMYAKAISMEPKNADLYRGRSQVYEREHKWQEAVNDLFEAIKLTEDTKANKQARRETRKRVVQLLQRWGSGQLAKYKTGWKAEFAKSPPVMDAGWYLVEAAARELQPREAELVLVKMEQLHKDDADVVADLARVLREQRKFDESVKKYERLLELQPGREREIYTTIAEIKTDDRKDDEAIIYVQKALEKSPNDPVAYVRLAERYEAMQNEAALAKAIAAYEKALTLAQKDFPTYFKLAKLYERNRDTATKAAPLYAKVLEKATDEQILEDAGQKAISLAVITGTLGELERALAPLAFTYGHKPVFRRLLVELYGRYVGRPGDPGQLVLQLEQGGAAADAARAELARLGTHGLKPLLEALADESDDVQQRIAVASLGYLGNKNAAQPLVRLVLKPVDTARRGTLGSNLDIDTRVDALVAAGRLGDERILPDLIALAGHSEKALREAAVFGLGRTRDKRAFPTLIAALDDRNESVQAQACMAVAEARATAATGKMVEVLRDRNRLDGTRATCAWALGVLGADAGVDPLIAALAEGNDETQRLAAWSLGMIGSKRAVPALLTAYFSRHEQVRATIGWSLARIDSGKAGPAPAPVDYKMSHHTFDVAATVRALPGPLGEVALAPALLVAHEKDILAGVRAAFARHTDLRVRMLSMLDESGGQLSLGPLTAGMTRAPAGERTKMNGLLDRLGVALTADLVQLAGDADAKVRMLALSVLAKIDRAEVRATLVAGLEDKDPLVRQAAMRAAGIHAARRPAEAPALATAVARHLRAADVAERQAAVEVMGMVGTQSDAPALIAALGDDNGFVREAAARSLGNVAGGAGAVDALERASRDPDPGVAAAAKQSLAALRNRKK